MGLRCHKARFRITWCWPESPATVTANAITWNAITSNALNANALPTVGEIGAGSVDDVLGVELPNGKTITK